MEEVKLTIDSINDIADMIKSALRNGYKVSVEPIYEPYWKTKIDHFDITFIKIAE